MTSPTATRSWRLRIVIGVLHYVTGSNIERGAGRSSDAPPCRGSRIRGATQLAAIVALGQRQPLGRGPIPLAREEQGGAVPQGERDRVVGSLASVDHADLDGEPGPDRRSASWWLDRAGWPCLGGTETGAGRARRLVAVGAAGLTCLGEDAQRGHLDEIRLGTGLVGQRGAAPRSARVELAGDLELPGRSGIGLVGPGRTRVREDELALACDLARRALGARRHDDRGLARAGVIAIDDDIDGVTTDPERDRAVGRAGRQRGADRCHGAADRTASWHLP